MNKPFAVAIDGPSGAGKSSIARHCAQELGFLYVDTGAIYRSVGLAALRQGLDPRDKAAVVAMLPSLEISLSHAPDGLQHMHLQGEDVTGEIRRPEVSLAASAVSAYPEVRAFLMEMQRSLARTHTVIMDGRDIGTVVLPDAPLKIFLTASPEARARRRWKELKDKGREQPLEEVLREMELRDKNDSQRSAAPLRAAEDAQVLDTTELNFQESCQAVIQMIRERWTP